MGAEGSYVCAIPTSVHYKYCIKNVQGAISLARSQTTRRNVRSMPNDLISIRAQRQEGVRVVSKVFIAVRKKAPSSTSPRKRTVAFPLLLFRTFAWAA